MAVLRSRFGACGAPLAAILALVMGITLSVAADSSRMRINLAGLGAQRCAFVYSGRVSKEAVRHWVEGFWSGLNYVAAASDQKQSMVDTGVMMSEVEKLCREVPSQVLASAAWTAFLTLNER